MKTPKIKQSNWITRYIDRLISHGYSAEDAVATYLAMDEIDYDTSPEDSADDEYSYGGR